MEIVRIPSVDVEGLELGGILCLGLDQLRFSLCGKTFFLLGVAVPVLILELSTCSDGEKYQIFEFELDAIVAQSCLAAVSLGCISHNLRKYGIRTSSLLIVIMATCADLARNQKSLKLPVKIPS
ncbi:hypothetical protein NE237_002471 [Protea cynaroides]|uniref:Uncharacterized protein n=1 Tax=Protea cynaroides TaxID=273540 RepID=A0A9Q0QZ26_9MAGN|nr:hypothetical protein NE237_002471 [Protea cynaroides]